MFGFFATYLPCHTVVLGLICRHRDIENSTYLKIILIKKTFVLSLLFTIKNFNLRKCLKQRKLTLKVQFRHFSSEPHYVNLQNTTFSSKPIHFFDKIKLILNSPGLNKKKTELPQNRTSSMDVPICKVYVYKIGTYIEQLPW